MDIFDLIGPIMVGPSSSHTAGAVRIGLACRRILGEEIAEADITLSGSFAATGRGHGTDKAIIAGLLGMAPDDVRVPDSFRYAQEKGLLFSFAFGDIPLSHPNTARLVLKGVGGAQADIEAASLGGGRIEIRRIGDMALRFSAEQPHAADRRASRPNPRAARHPACGLHQSGLKGRRGRWLCFIPYAGLKRWRWKAPSRSGGRSCLPPRKRAASVRSSLSGK